MCAHYMLLPHVDRCPETIDVCIWHMFVFMSAVESVWGSVGIFVAAAVENSFFLPWSVEVCCVFV